MAVLIAVVTHNGEQTIESTLKAALALDPGVPILVIDNASTDETLRVVQTLHTSRIRVLRNDANVGVGAAFNEGLRQARFMCAQWLMLLDQDSQPDANMLRVIRSVFDETVADVAFPTIRCRCYPDIVHFPMDWTGVGFDAVVPGKEASALIPVDSSISSGALYRVSALEAIDGFNEGYFIDFVDHECHLRLQEAGFKLLWVREAQLWHDLGRIQRMTDSGLWIEHAPIRYYYMARNMVRGYWRFGGMRALKNLYREMRTHVDRLRTYSDRAEACIAYMKWGVLHGILGKTGKCDPRIRL